MAISNEEWQAFKEWAAKELNDSAFRVNFMTGEEIGAEFAPEKALKDSHEESEEIEQFRRDEEKRRKLQLQALAGTLGCNIYLAAYLTELKDRLNVVADAFGRLDLTNEKSLADAETRNRKALGNLKTFKGALQKAGWQ